MITNYTDLKTVVVNKLKALQIGGSDAFIEVYKVNASKPKGYPCAMVVESAGEGEILDTGRNERIVEFKIKLVQEMGIKTPTQASTIRLSITDAVMRMFDEAPQLKVSGADSVVRVNITPISFDEITKDRTIFESEFIVQCVIIVNNYP